MFKPITERPIGCLETFDLVSVGHRGNDRLLTYEITYKKSIDSVRAVQAAIGLAIARTYHA
jgi:hypothetical protein